MTDSQIGAIRALLTSRPRPTDLAERRARVDWLGQQDPLPADVHVEPVEANGVAAEWTWTPGADPSRVVMFLHGGGYVSGSIASHRGTVSQLGREAGTRTLALGYRLAPEHPFPAALEDALAAYRFLLAQGFRAEDIAIGGESAGGGLTIATLAALRDAGDPLPGCAWCASPWVDLEMTGATMATKDAEDPLIHKAYLEDLARQYLAGADPRDPRASSLHADMRGLPPLLIQVGSAETLLDDAVRLAGAAGAAGVEVTLRVWPDMIHAWHLYWQRLGAAHRSLAEAGAFIRAKLR
jgi:acetyl esterase/lipase